MSRITMATAAAVLFLAALGACTDSDGPAESAGERIDDAVSDAEDRLEDAGDEVEEAAEEIGDALQDN